MTERDWVPATTAHDYDGINHLVALTDDIQGWVVTLHHDDGRVVVVEPEPFAWALYYPAIAGRPCWFIDIPKTIWSLTVNGKPMGIRGDRGGNIPE
jgi:hypothetical protein